MIFKEICIILYHNIKELFLIICEFFAKFGYWGRKEYKKGNYSNIYFVVGMVVTIITLLIYKYTSFIFLIIKAIISLSLVWIVIYSMVKIVKSKLSNKEIYYKNMRDWYFAIAFYSGIWMLNLQYLGGYSILISNIVLGISFCFMLCYECAYFLLKYIRNWVWYSLIFIAMPIVSTILWSFLGLLIADIFKMPVIASDNVFGWMVLILTVILLNLSINITPDERFREVKVATYFVLAIFSTLSYCFFISDYLTNVILSISNRFSKEEIKTAIEYCIKWGCLPYLIGTVFGCFSLELTERNRVKKTGQNKKEINKKEVSM